MTQSNPSHVGSEHWPHDDTLHAWWVEPGLLLAGEHPEMFQDDEPGTVEGRLSLLSAAGIVTTVDLASRGAPETGYGSHWVEQGRRLGREHRRLVRPIDDRGVIGGDGFLDLVDEIDDEIVAGRPVYVHCAYGVGRTGTVIGLWLRRCRGLAFDNAMSRIAAARAGTRRADWRCPDTGEQLEVIRSGGDVGGHSAILGDFGRRA